MSALRTLKGAKAQAAAGAVKIMTIYLIDKSREK